MGKCLSKSARKAEDPDKVPYLPSVKQAPDSPSTTPGEKQSLPAITSAQPQQQPSPPPAPTSPNKDKTPRDNETKKEASPPKVTPIPITVEKSKPEEPKVVTPVSKQVITPVPKHGQNAPATRTTPAPANEPPSSKEGVRKPDDVKIDVINVSKPKDIRSDFFTSPKETEAPKTSPFPSLNNWDLTKSESSRTVTVTKQSVQSSRTMVSTEKVIDAKPSLSTAPLGTSSVLSSTTTYSREQGLTSSLGNDKTQTTKMEQTYVSGSNKDPENSSQQPMALLGALQYLKSDNDDSVVKVESSKSSSYQRIETSQTSGGVTKSSLDEKTLEVTSPVNGVVTTKEEVKKTIIDASKDDKPVVKEETTKTVIETKDGKEVAKMVESHRSSTEVPSDGEAGERAKSPRRSIPSPSIRSPSHAPPLNAEIEKNGLEINGSPVKSSDAVSSPSSVSLTSPTASESSNLPDVVDGEEASLNEENFTNDVFDVEPQPFKNLKRNIQNIFLDFSPFNDRIISKHKVHNNTRSKLLGAIDKWFMQSKSDSENPKVMLIHGITGMGKTTVAAEVCRRYANNLAGYHLFSYNDPNIDHNNLRSVIISLAHKFCEVFPNYINLLPKLEKLEELVTHADVTELYNTLVFHPLSSADLQHPANKRMILVIDALDECNPQDQDVLMDIIGNLTEFAPEWMYVLLTIKTDPEVISSLENTQVIELKRTNETLTDIKRYMKDALGQFMDRISLDGGLTQLAKKTEGLFLCGHVLRGRLNALPEGTSLALREVDPLFPSGLNANCKELFSKFQEGLSSNRSLYPTVLAVLMESKEPIHIDFLDFVLGNKGASTVKNNIHILDPVLKNDQGCLSFVSRRIPEWLEDSNQSGNLAVDSTIGRTHLASLCTIVLGDIMPDQENKTVQPQLKEYALKHALYHFLDIPKKHEPIGTILCSLKYIQEKLKVEGVSIEHVLNDYEHEHISENKCITLKEYMKKFPKLSEQIRYYQKFLTDKKVHIKSSPLFLYHIAANYSSVGRIKQNAHVELENNPWIEDITTVPETNAIEKSLNGSIRAVDLSPDGSTVAAVVKDEEYNVKLYLINSQTGDLRLPPIDIKSLNDRVGLVAKFMSDGNSVFVGSLTTLIGIKGNQIGSGLDVTTVTLKEKFSIECVDISAKHMVCGLSTFPWGGRSLHLSTFDMRTKKCLKTIEILRFRFGGSAQFGIKCVGLATERPLMCACVKQSTKAQLKVIVYNISKFQVMNSIDVNNDDITKCLFVGDSTLLMGSGIKTTAMSKPNVPIIPIVPEYWDFKEISNKNSHIWNDQEKYSLFAGDCENTIACRWFSSSGTAVIETYSNSKINGTPDSKYKIRGIVDVGEMFMSERMLVFVSHNTLIMYDMDSLEPADNHQDPNMVPNVYDVDVVHMSFLPKSDTALLICKQNDFYDVYECDLNQEEVMLTRTAFTQQEISDVHSFDPEGQTPFQGANPHGDICFPNGDGSCLVFNSGSELKVVSRSSNREHRLPTYEKCRDKVEISEYKDCHKVHAAASPKENTIAVIYGQMPGIIYLMDIRNANVTKRLQSSEGHLGDSRILDITFLPSNGFILSYHRHGNGTAIVTWNQRTGECLSKDDISVSYVKVSPASDRFIISSRKSKDEGSLILRNSDNKFNKKLALGGATWHAASQDSDVGFSSDGTTVVGLCRGAALCRVWNAGNGEVLQDLPVDFNNVADVVGMLTNTHVVFSDAGLTVVDIASGETSVVLPFSEQMDDKCSHRGLAIAPKGNIITGVSASGRLSVYRCHNFETIKRKTTLQRMKSFQK